MAMGQSQERTADSQFVEQDPDVSLTKKLLVFDDH